MKPWMQCAARCEHLQCAVAGSRNGGTQGSCPRSGAVQLEADPDSRRQRLERRARDTDDSRYLHDCHNSPNVGNHSVPLPLDIGLADASRRTADMPLYTLRHKASGATSADDRPGTRVDQWQMERHRALQRSDIARTCDACAVLSQRLCERPARAVDFYDTRFGMGLTADEKNDLVAFLLTL